MFRLVWGRSQGLVSLQPHAKHCQMLPFQFGSVFQQACSSIEIWQPAGMLWMECAVTTLEILGKMFIRHKSVEPLCFVSNESPLIQSDGCCNNTVQCVCYRPIPKYCHSIMGSAVLGIHPALSCSFIPAHNIWPWRASAPDALLYLFHPRAEEPPRTGVPVGRECRKEDEWNRIAPCSLLLAVGDLRAARWSQPLNNGLGRCALREGGVRAQTQCSLFWLQVQGNLGGLV